MLFLCFSVAVTSIEFASMSYTMETSGRLSSEESSAQVGVEGADLIHASDLGKVL